MATPPAFFSSILNIPNSKISNPNFGFPQISFPARKKLNFTHSHSINPISIVENPPSSSARCNSATITNSLTLDHDSINDELEKAESKFGSKVRVKVPLKVYHVPKVPEVDLMGRIGVLKQYVGVYKGKRISANLPYKVEFVADEVLGRDGKPVKFLAHLREDEFELLD
ncbi:ferredoxin-thioredoxin reductase variable chain [Phtheirospermum japonicum]|uniref:Ferredoxin-thioredoxin reductase variable chain n=1 Tax=Phtheirospermum japonicum TaxID=374723 RepID=A0A830BTK4_9LAMI|nr:ferredoxin-thioredoxin reductase variable chain [Phtheirospermum japonicum]